MYPARLPPPRMSITHAGSPAGLTRAGRPSRTAPPTGPAYGAWPMPACVSSGWRRSSRSHRTARPPSARACWPFSPPAAWRATSARPAASAPPPRSLSLRGNVGPAGVRSLAHPGPCTRLWAAETHLRSRSEPCGACTATRWARCPLERQIRCPGLTLAPRGSPCRDAHSFASRSHARAPRPTRPCRTADWVYGWSQALPRERLKGRLARCDGRTLCGDVTGERWGIRKAAGDDLGAWCRLPAHPLPAPGSRLAGGLARSQPPHLGIAPGPPPTALPAGPPAPSHPRPRRPIRTPGPRAGARGG